MPYRTSTVLPSTRRPGAIRALCIRGCAYHGTDAALIDHRCGLQVGFTTLTDIFVYFQNFKHSVHAPHRIQNAFPLLVCLNRSSANNAEGQRVLRGGVESSARDGAAPELNPGWVHRRMNTGPEVRCVQHSIIQHSTSTDAPKSFAGESPALPDNALPAETLIIKRHILARWF